MDWLAGSGESWFGRPCVTWSGNFHSGGAGALLHDGREKFPYCTTLGVGVAGSLVSSSGRDVKG